MVDSFLQLSNLLDAPLRRLGPLLVDAALLPLPLDLAALVVAPRPLHRPAIRTYHHGQVLLFLRVPSHHTLGLLHLPRLVRHEVELVLLHLQPSLLRLDVPVDFHAQVELLGRRLLSPCPGSPSPRLAAHFLAVDLDVEALEVFGRSGGGGAALLLQSPASPLRHAGATRRRLGLPLRALSRRGAGSSATAEARLRGCRGGSLAPFDARQVLLCLRRRAGVQLGLPHDPHRAGGEHVANLLLSRPEAAELLDEVGRGRLAAVPGRGHGRRVVVRRALQRGLAAAEGRVDEELQLRWPAAGVQQLLRALDALLRRGRPRLVVEPIGRHHGFVEAVDLRVRLVDDRAKALHLVLHRGHRADQRLARRPRPGAGPGRLQLLPQEEHQLHGVRQVVDRHQRHRQASLAGARRAPRPVHEKLGAGRKVKVQHVVQ
mmetsp:Transcript_75033/g.202872  ORF Transcript_75033/g.202872 Transcript_75033/m.202872 type:complete len:430 (+) Transcript_75033:633-1922(+)